MPVNNVINSCKALAIAGQIFDIDLVFSRKRADNVDHPCLVECRIAIVYGHVEFVAEVINWQSLLSD